ncbi:hypothetical protein FA95DRAFT_1565655 [Auriscalpium vulgare]|uniref:Uncharacterized protein n=1 Tax=Auriscalpium vulgare TaxID=40419 RepID=A0ACB8RAF9_9AGAM|nr:hypothetical protein FA95DRAFT_1565655 [Auriscalpium vulgare]
MDLDDNPGGPVADANPPLDRDDNPDGPVADANTPLDRDDNPSGLVADANPPLDRDDNLPDAPVADDAILAQLGKRKRTEDNETHHETHTKTSLEDQRVLSQKQRDLAQKKGWPLTRVVLWGARVITRRKAYGREYRVEYSIGEDGRGKMKFMGRPDESATGPPLLREEFSIDAEKIRSIDESGRASLSFSRFASTVAQASGEGSSGDAEKIPDRPRPAKRVRFNVDGDVGRDEDEGNALHEGLAADAPTIPEGGVGPPYPSGTASNGRPPAPVREPRSTPFEPPYHPAPATNPGAASGSHTPGGSGAPVSGSVVPDAEMSSGGASHGHQPAPGREPLTNAEMSSGGASHGHQPAPGREPLTTPHDPPLTHGDDAVLSAALARIDAILQRFWSCQEAFVVPPTVDYTLPDGTSAVVSTTYVLDPATDVPDESAVLSKPPANRAIDAYVEQLSALSRELNSMSPSEGPVRSARNSAVEAIEFAIREFETWYKVIWGKHQREMASREPSTPLSAPSGPLPTPASTARPSHSHNRADALHQIEALASKLSSLRQAYSPPSALEVELPDGTRVTIPTHYKLDSTVTIHDDGAILTVSPENEPIHVLAEDLKAVSQELDSIPRSGAQDNRQALVNDLEDCVQALDRWWKGMWTMHRQEASIDVDMIDATGHPATFSAPESSPRGGSASGYAPSSVPSSHGGRDRHDAPLDVPPVEPLPDAVPASKGDIQRLSEQIARLNAVIENGGPSSGPSSGASPAHSDDAHPREVPPPVQSEFTRTGRRRNTLHGYVATNPTPQSKPYDHLLLHRNVRELAGSLLGRDDPRASFPTPPGQTAIKKFNDSGLGGPTQDNFRIDMSGPQKSLWNMQLASVFVDKFLAAGYTCQDPSVIKTAFISHLKTLRGHYKEQQNPTDGRPKKVRRLEATRRHERLGSTLSFRQKACNYHEELLKYSPLLTKMGKHGMSGDESDHQGGRRGGHRGYGIVDDVWRSEDVRPFVRILDLLYLELKFKADGGVARGNWPRFRTPTGRTKPGTPVIGLPQNIYARDWLATLSPQRKDELAMEGSISLEIPEHLKRRAARYIHCDGVTTVQPLEESEVNLGELEHYLLTGRTFAQDKGKAKAL